MDIAIVSALSALLGAIVGVAGGIVGISVQARRARDAWWRERRLDAYTAFLTVTDRAMDEVQRETVAHLDKAMKARGEAKRLIAEGLRTIELLAPPVVHRAALLVTLAVEDAVESDLAIPDQMARWHECRASFVSRSTATLAR